MTRPARSPGRVPTPRYGRLFRGDGSQRSAGGDESGESVAADGGELAGIDEERLHAIVRDAVEDAILGAIGTVLLGGSGLVLFWSGLAGLDRASNDPGTAMLLAAFVGGLAIVVVTLRDGRTASDLL